MESRSSSIISTSKLTSTYPIGRPRLPNKIRTVRLKPVFAKNDGYGYGYGWDFGSESESVDRNMIVLRKRIHEIKVAEHNYEPPSYWMEWEKRYYASYGSDVCGILCLLQTFLMDIRPSLAIGLVFLVAMSLPTSTILILVHLVGAMRSVIFGG